MVTPRTLCGLRPWQVGCCRVRVNPCAWSTARSLAALQPGTQRRFKSPCAAGKGSHAVNDGSNLGPRTAWVQLGSKPLNRSVAVLRAVVLSRCPRSLGEVPERSNGAVSKTVVPLTGDRGFESLPLRHLKCRQGPGPLRSVTPADCLSQ